MSDGKNVNVAIFDELETNNRVTDEFMNDNDIEEFRLLNLKSKASDINKYVENISNAQKSLVNEDTEFEYIDTVLESLTEEQINEMSTSEIDKLLVDSEGNQLHFTIDFSDDHKAFAKFKKEFLILRKQSNETLKKFDEELAKINKEIADSQDEFDQLVKQFGNVSTLIRTKLNERLEAADTDSKRALIQKLITSFEYGFNLDNIKEYCKSYRGNSIIGDYRDDKRAKYIYRRYLKVINDFNIKTNLTAFKKLENKFLPEEYQNRPNIFVFAVIHYISSWHNKNYTKADGLFITQFTVNLKNLYYDKFDTVEEKEQFIAHIKEIIDIIG